MPRRSGRESCVPQGARRITAIAALAAALMAGGPGPARSDDFAALNGAPLFELEGRADSLKRSAIGLRALEALPTVLHDERAAFLLVKTGDGNLAKLLVSSGLRKLKPAEKESPVIPVLVLERFETVDAGDHRSFKARGRDVMLFDGFQYDLDTGCVVPEGLGGDIVFRAGGADGPQLAGTRAASLITFEQPIPAPALEAGKPSSGRAVAPTDFAGRYYLVANGQWSGTLELAVDAERSVTGQFRSDKNGSSYSVAGAVSPDIPHKLQFSIQFPRAKQTYDGLLWTEGKSAIAGTVSMLDRQYGFVAVREGSSLVCEAFDLSPRTIVPTKSEYRIVVLQAGSDGYTLDGKASSPAELTTALAAAVKANPATKVLLRVAETIPCDRVLQAARLIDGTGVRSIRLAPAGGSDKPR
jgi:hypothetical protein